MDAIEMEAFFAQSMSYENVPVVPGEMSPRERFYAIMDFARFDRVMDCEFGYWNDTLRRWHNEGLPKQVDSIPKADLFFGFDRWQKNLPVPNNILPFFEEEIIERNERHTIGYDGRRVKRKVFTDGTDSIPHYLDFPIKDRESYLPFKERFLPQLEQRIPATIAEIARQSAQRNYCLLLYAGSTAGWIRDLMGFEGFSLGTCLQPELIDEILADLSQLYESIATALVNSGIEVDVVAWWEDIAFKTGPIVSPEWFSEKCGPVYRRTLTRYAQNGTRFSYVDCDGDNRLLVPTWIDNGVNIIFPLEVNAGIHPQTLRSRYPEIRMMGGFDKVVLLQGPDAIRKELLRLKPLVEEGGFIPHVDHRVQADVPYKDYLYYLEAKRDLFGIPNKIISTDALVGSEG